MALLGLSCCNSSLYVLWRIDPLLGKDLEADKETTAVSMQQRRKHASTTVELLLV
jgi:hypothetical protein